jgi:hypothetical protein
LVTAGNMHDAAQIWNEKRLFADHSGDACP